jgi:membrane protein DedA with SNARE-associated domain/membrane-associated phospholipid phosphatase
MINTIASHILTLPVWVALILVFAVPALESSAFVGFVFPGEITLLLGGVLAYEGRVSVAAVLVAGIAGAIVGDSVGYLVGRRYGRHLLEGTLGRWVNHRHFDHAERYRSERGGKAVFVGRFTAALRVMIPGLAGMSRMHYPTFLVYNIAGGVGWVVLSVALGYAGGSSWRHMEHLASRIGLLALAVVVLGVVGGYLLRTSRDGRAQRLLMRLHGSRPVTWVFARFPGQVAWAARRLDPTSTTGLALTVATAVAVATTWTFLGVTQDVLAHEELTRLDPRVHLWILGHRVGWLNHAMQVLTWLGANAVVVPILAVAAVLLRLARHSWSPAVGMGVVYGAAILVHATVAELVHRPRPASTDWIVSASGWSYPSGHTIQATAAYGILTILLAQGAPARVKAWLVSAACLVVSLVAASRMYLGVHWLSDVIGSMCLGAAVVSVWAIGSMVVFPGAWARAGAPPPNTSAG